MTSFRHIPFVALFATGALSAPASSQVASSQVAIRPAALCGPGASFGITAYRAAEFSSTRYADSASLTYTFGAEPVVLQVDSTSQVRPGDVVVAVNRNPITTRAGADMFAYPSGDVVLTVRRGGANVDFTYSFQPAGPCLLEYNGLRYALTGRGRGGRGGAAIDTAATGGTMRGRGGGGGRGGRGAVTAAGGRATAGTVDTAAYRSTLQLVPRLSAAAFGTATANVAVANFGLTLVCRPACTRGRADDSTSYWQFTSFPAVAQPVVTGVAEKAGIQPGDILISVNGHSPITEEGALALEKAGTLLSLTLEFSRAGERRTYTLKL